MVAFRRQRSNTLFLLGAQRRARPVRLGERREYVELWHGQPPKAIFGNPTSSTRLRIGNPISDLIDDELGDQLELCLWEES